jgi:hypothetical protein
MSGSHIAILSGFDRLPESGIRLQASWPERKPAVRRFGSLIVVMPRYSGGERGAT